MAHQRILIPGIATRVNYTPVDLLLLDGLPFAGAGKTLFVNSTATAGNGLLPTAPMASLVVAYAAAVAGDTIIALPGHVETIVAAGGLTLSKANVHIFGVGEGATQPRINFTTLTTASVLVTAASNRLSGFYITLNGIDALANPINVQAADFMFDNNLVVTADGTNQAVLALLTSAAANRLVVFGNRFLGTVDAGMTAAIRIVGGDGHVIQGNQFMGAYGSGVGAIQGLTTLCTSCYVLGNYINNLTAGCTKAMVFVTLSTGQISDNMMQILAGTAPITGDAMSWVGRNYYAATIATGSTLV